MTDADARTKSTSAESRQTDIHGESVVTPNAVVLGRSWKKTRLRDKDDKNMLLGSEAVRLQGMALIAQEGREWEGVVMSMAPNTYPLELPCKQGTWILVEATRIEVGGSRGRKRDG